MPEGPDAAAAPREGAHPASPEDLPRLAELLDEAARSVATARGGARLLAEHGVLPPQDRPTTALLDDADAFLASGWFEGELVGVAVARAVAVAGDAPVGVVTTLYVEPPARGVGVGESMLAALVDWCTARGCTDIDVAALPGDRATKSLLERAGFTARKIVMHHPL